MWNRNSDNDILYFALLWQPLGGPAPNTCRRPRHPGLPRPGHRCCQRPTEPTPAGRHLPEHTYGIPAITTLIRNPQRDAPGDRHIGLRGAANSAMT